MKRISTKGLYASIKHSKQLLFKIRKTQKQVATYEVLEGNTDCYWNVVKEFNTIKEAKEFIEGL